MTTASAVRDKIWAGRVPLQIRLASPDCTTYDESDSYMLLAPRISYLPLLLPRVLAFFRSLLIAGEAREEDGWFSFEDVPLKWHHPIGLLFDLYSRATDALVEETHGKQEGSGSEPSMDSGDVLPWKLTVHFSRWPEALVRMDEPGRGLPDAFRNSQKEASYIRHGSGKVIMALGKEETNALWEAVGSTNVQMYTTANQKLLHPKGEAMKHVPIKIYLPEMPVDDSQWITKAGHLKVVQGLITPSLPSRQPQTLGSTLNVLLPTLFPSRRSPLLAYPVLHGAIVPMGVAVAELAEYAAYADGFLHITIAMMS